MASRSLTITLLAAIVVVGSCGGSHAAQTGSAVTKSPATTSKVPTTTAPATTTTKPAVVPSGAQLHAALLSVSDLPTGWGTAPSSQNNKSTNNDTLCDKKTPTVPDTPNTNTVSYSPGGYLPMLINAVDAAPEPQTRARFAALRSSLSRCVAKPWTEMDTDGTRTTYTIGEVSFPQLGDESFAYRIQAATDFGTVAFDLIAIRRATVTTMLVGMSGTVVLLGTGQMPTGLLERAARASLAKVDGLFR